MLKSALSLMVLVPAVVAAQASVGASAQTQTQTSASAQVGRSNASVESQTSVEGEIAIARAHRVPDRPIRRRAAEGRAKGASEAQMAASARTLRLELEAAYDAMVRAGRDRPSDGEVERGASAMEHGYTAAQIEAVAKSAPSDRSLVVAFDVLTRLSERGVPVTKALAQVSTKLESRAPDAEIDAIVAPNPSAGKSDVAPSNGNVGAVVGKGNAAAGVAGAAGASAGAAKGTVSGTVTGVLKKP